MTDQDYVRVVPRPAPIEAVSSPRTAPDGRTLGEAQRVFLPIPSREIDRLVRLAASPAAGLSNHQDLGQIVCGHKPHDLAVLHDGQSVTIAVA